MIMQTTLSLLVYKVMNVHTIRRLWTGEISYKNHAPVKH